MSEDTPTLPLTFGQWLKQRREEKGLSQGEIAEAAGCEPGYISNLERGAYERKDGKTNQPNKEFVVKIAHKLGVSEVEALDAAGYVVYMPELTKNQLRAADLIGRLPLKPYDRQEEAIRELEFKVKMFGQQGGGGGKLTVKPGDEGWRRPIGKTAPKKRSKPRHIKEAARKRA